MGENIASGVSLFDLLARYWTLESAIEQAEYNYDDTAVAFRLASGKIALASVEDSESPKKRTRLEVDTGRTTIRPRKNSVRPLTTPDITLSPHLPIVRFGTNSFAAINQERALQQIMADGQVTTKLKPFDSKVTSICNSFDGQIVALGLLDRIMLYETDEMKVLAEVKLDFPVTCQAISNDAKMLAAWGNDTLILIDLQNPSTAPKTIDCKGEITEISWRKSDSHLACASADRSFYIIDCSAGTSQRIEDFPSPVRNVAFCEAGGALVASGAFRLVSWDSSDLPKNDQPGKPLTTGKAGFVAINVIAVHPKRNLVATGYANGLVAIASIGKVEEMILHHEKATEVTNLFWSKTGEHLTIGYASGKAAIVTFPEQMFK